MKENIRGLPTEKPNPRTGKLDTLSTVEMLSLINREDEIVPKSVKKIIKKIAWFVDNAADRLKRGGRLFYAGAGTSGRLGILDASECPPTFGTDPGVVQGIIAGGNPAVFHAMEGAEDNETTGAKALAAKKLSSRDCVVGISASGATPFTAGALKFARKQKALTAAVSCNPRSRFADFCDVLLAASVGPEVIAGSTRLKCGTAQKLILNMISTGIMIRLGKVKGNRMIDLKPKSRKLWERATGLVMEELRVSGQKAASLLKRAGGNARKAIETSEKR